MLFFTKIQEEKKGHSPVIALHPQPAAAAWLKLIAGLVLGRLVC